MCVQMRAYYAPCNPYAVGLSLSGLLPRPHRAHSEGRSWSALRARLKPPVYRPVRVVCGPGAHLGRR